VADRAEASGNEVRLIPLGLVVPSAGQPRRNFREEEVAELAASMREVGLLQPIVVRERREGGYELIAGERRLRAARSLGLTAIPAVVVAMGDVEARLAQLVENLQRQELSAVEVAEGLRRVSEEFGLTQEELARRLGLSQAAVANKMRLTRLDPRVKELARRERIGERHLRALLPVADGAAQLALAEEIVARQLTVREVERRVALLLAPGKERRVRLGAVQDVRIFLNTFRAAVTALVARGVKAELVERDLGEMVEVVIRVAKRKGTGRRT